MGSCCSVPARQKTNNLPRDQDVFSPRDEQESRSRETTNSGDESAAAEGSSTNPLGTANNPSASLAAPNLESSSVLFPRSVVSFMSDTMGSSGRRSSGDSHDTNPYRPGDVADLTLLPIHSAIEEFTDNDMSHSDRSRMTNDDDQNSQMTLSSPKSKSGTASGASTSTGGTAPFSTIVSQIEADNYVPVIPVPF